MPRGWFERVPEPKRSRAGDRSAPARLDPGAQEMLGLQRLAGNQAVVRALRAAPPASPTLARLVDFDTFQTDTNIEGVGRKKLKNIDAAIKAVHQVPSADIVARRDALRKLVLECRAYAAGDHHQERIDAVKRLYADADAELDMVGLAASAWEATDLRWGLRALLRAQERQLKLSARGVPNLDYFAIFMNAAATRLRQASLSGAGAGVELADVVRDDLVRLKEMRDDPGTPPLLASILTEILANDAMVTLEEGLPGATKTPGGPSAYKVKHKLDQPGGEAERLGSLAHELTHVSISESYDNTAIMMAFPKDATDAEVDALAQTRKTDSDALGALVAADTTLSDRQKSDLNAKIAYGKENKLGVYIANYRAANKITDQERANLEHWWSQPHLKAIGSIVIEYDTTVNQMLMWMHLWNIPATNPVHAKLIQMAQDAYNERAAARARNARTVPAPTYARPPAGTFG